MTTRLSPRRFPETIIRRRVGEGSYVLGQYRPGKPVDTDLRANVQPLALEDSDFVGGAQVVERIKVYVPASSGNLQAAFETMAADQVLYGGKVYTVEESRTWPRFTRATLLRES